MYYPITFNPLELQQQNLARITNNTGHKEKQTTLAVEQSSYTC